MKYVLWLVSLCGKNKLRGASPGVPARAKLGSIDFTFPTGSKLPSLLLAVGLQLLPITRIFLATPAVTGSSFAVVPAWLGGLAALMGSYNALSGASTRITSPGTAKGTNGVPFSYRITVGPQSANRFSAAPLPAGLTCGTSSGRITGTPTQTGVFNVLLTASDGGRASRTVTKTLALTILADGNSAAPPSIVSQPTSQTGTVGGGATLTVVATGVGPLSYQWRHANVMVAGGTNSTLTLANLTTNQAGSYTVIVANQWGSATSAVATLTVVNRFMALKGNYAGLFYPNTPEPPTGQSGHFTMTVTDQGAFTGKLLLAGSSYAVSGQFDILLAATKTILRKGTNEVVLHLQLSDASDQVSGYVSNADWNSDLYGYRMPYDAKLNPATNPSGNYTMLLSGGADSASNPAGLSPATLNITTAGTVTLKITMADGTAVVQKTSLAANGQTPVYANLYKGGGSLIGWLTVTNTNTNDIPGLLVWTKNNGVAGKLYPGGFTNEMLSLASRYTPPATGSAVVGLSNPVLILQGGNLTEPITNGVVLSTLNKFSVTPPNASKLALTVKPASGVLSGTFVHPQTLKKSTIKGVVLQKQNLGGGFFLGTEQSGSAFLGRPEDSNVFAP